MIVALVVGIWGLTSCGFLASLGWMASGPCPKMDESDEFLTNSEWGEDFCSRRVQFEIG